MIADKMADKMANKTVGATNIVTVSRRCNAQLVEDVFVGRVEAPEQDRQPVHPPEFVNDAPLVRLLHLRI